MDLGVGWVRQRLDSVSRCGEEGLGVKVPVSLCIPLLAWLIESRWWSQPAGIMAIDVEGFDCRIVESHDWCSEELHPVRSR